MANGILSERQTKRNKVILIAQRGWIFVGDLHKDGEDNVLVNASCIRVWGTTKGIGELALEGPKSLTKLDLLGEIRIHKLATIGIINTKSELWK